MEEKLPPGTGGFINPQKVIEQIGLKEGAKVADFGCGHGYFTIPVAKLVGKEGKVYAVDILLEALEAVRSRAQLENAPNIETVRGNLEAANGSRLPDNSVDLVLLHNVLFQTQKKLEIIKEARRTLKQGGTFVLIDWKKEVAAIGPRDGGRLSFDEARALGQEAGFVFNRVFDAGRYHFGLVFFKA